MKWTLCLDMVAVFILLNLLAQLWLTCIGLQAGRQTDRGAVAEWLVSCLQGETAVLLQLACSSWILHFPPAPQNLSCPCCVCVRAQSSSEAPPSPLLCASWNRLEEPWCWLEEQEVPPHPDSEDPLLPYVIIKSGQVDFTVVPDAHKYTVTHGGGGGCIYTVTGVRCRLTTWVLDMDPT